MKYMQTNPRFVQKMSQKMNQGVNSGVKACEVKLKECVYLEKKR